jgi:tyrosine-protein phosphatase SIW14
MRSVLNRWRLGLGVLLALLGTLTIAWYARSQERAYRNLHTVTPGVLYRCGQLTPKGLERVLHELNIGTLVNLRARDARRENDTTDWEAKLCAKNFLHFAAIPLGSPEQPHKITRVEAERTIDAAVKQFLAILDSPERYPRPILVHCLAGVHRTGVMAAIYRMEYEGWSKEKALTEMRDLGYDDFDSFDPLRDYVVNWIPLRERKATSPGDVMTPLSRGSSAGPGAGGSRTR